MDNKEEDEQQSDQRLKSKNAVSKDKKPLSKTKVMDNTAVSKSEKNGTAKQIELNVEQNMESDPLHISSESNMDSNDNDQQQSDEQLKGSKNDIDFAIFNDTNPSGAVKRVIYALKYYMAMTRKMDKEGITTFTDFIKSIYKNYLNDITHITDLRSDDLEDIHKSLFNEYGFKPCDLRKCKISGRHSAVNGTKKDEDSIPRMDALSQFIIDSFDSVHFYLFHLYDVGLRTLRAEIDSEHKDDDEIEDEDAPQSQFVDRAFLRRKNKVKSIRNELRDYFQRFQGEENKFVISGKAGLRNETDKKTYIQRFIDCVDGGRRLMRYLMEQGFDTEAINDDI